MGRLIDGVWHDDGVAKNDKGGQFVRPDSVFRNWITIDGRPGPSGESGFEAEADRYHLYISHACPWAHRTVIFRNLKSLAPLITVSVVNHYMGEKGWTFDGESTGDSLYGATHLHQIYTRAKADYTGKVTVPVLWDKKRETIVSNESAEIIRMFNSAFNAITSNHDDYHPVRLADQIDAVNERVYHAVNNGVYKAGFAASQSAHDDAATELFDVLDAMEERLSKSRYLVGDTLTEADIRLFTTLIRFDAVYHTHFKCNLRRIEDYPQLSNYMREIYQMDAVRATVDFHHIKAHYYASHPSVNPKGLIPIGPALDLDRAHDRSRFSTNQG